MASELEQMARQILNVPPVAEEIETCRFKDMADACDRLGVDDSGNEPLLTTFPQFDIGHEEVVNIGGPFNGIPHLVYATIDRAGRQSCRATVFPAWWREAE